jgi:hypothetical protein
VFIYLLTNIHSHEDLKMKRLNAWNKLKQEANRNIKEEQGTTLETASITSS